MEELNMFIATHANPWADCAFSFAVQTFHNACPLEPTWNWHKSAKQSQLLSALMKHTSPWQAMYDCGLTIISRPPIWPVLMEIVMGPPVASDNMLAPRWRLPLVMAVDLNCCHCSKALTEIFDSVCQTPQEWADGIICPHCNAQAWPWPKSRLMAIPESADPGPEDELQRLDNILQFCNLTKGFPNA